MAVPALVVAGADTARLILPLRWMGDDVLRALPRARREVIAGAGHDPWFEQPDALFADVRWFLVP